MLSWGHMMKHVVGAKTGAIETRSPSKPTAARKGNPRGGLQPRFRILTLNVGGLSVSVNWMASCWHSHQNQGRRGYDSHSPQVSECCLVEPFEPRFTGPKNELRSSTFINMPGPTKTQPSKILHRDIRFSTKSHARFSILLEETPS